MVTPGLRVLELNADFIPLHLVPLSTISWQEAFKKLVEEVAVPVSYYEGEYVHTPTLKLPVPSVIIMKDYKSFNKRAKWSKYNVKLRDNFRCQYCHKRFSPKSLTIDHVHPKSAGGKFTWENSVAACKACNNEKKNSTNYLSWIPKKEPYRPDYLELASKQVKKMGDINSEWSQYIDWLRTKK